MATIIERDAHQELEELEKVYDTAMENGQGYVAVAARKQIWAIKEYLHSEEVKAAIEILEKTNGSQIKASIEGLYQEI
jgi:hypothetical protein